MKYKNNFDYDIIIIGGGSGGLIAASEAVALHARVLLLEKHKMGGDCLNYGCVPSKAFLKSAQIMNTIKNAHKFGIMANHVSVSIQNVMSYVKKTIAAIEVHDSVATFTALGVHVVMKQGKIIDAHTVEAGKKQYTAKNIIIATGSTAIIPNIPDLSKIKYYTNETIFDIQTLPKKLIVLGAGPVGLELGQGFAFLGSCVHIIDKSDRIFVHDEPEVAKILMSTLKNDGIHLHLSSKIIAVNKKNDKTIEIIIQDAEKKQIKIQGDALLIALGRKPVTEQLFSALFSVQQDKNGKIITNSLLQTTEPGIFACGDVCYFT